MNAEGWPGVDGCPNDGVWPNPDGFPNPGAWPGVDGCPNELCPKVGFADGAAEGVPHRLGFDPSAFELPKDGFAAPLEAAGVPHALGF